MELTGAQTLHKSLSNLPLGTIMIVTDKEFKTYKGFIQKVSASGLGSKCYVIKGSKAYIRALYIDKFKQYIKDGMLTHSIEFDTIVDAALFIMGDSVTPINKSLCLSNRELTESENALSLMSKRLEYDTKIKQGYSGITEDQVIELRKRVIQKLVSTDEEGEILSFSKLLANESIVENIHEDKIDRTEVTEQQTEISHTVETNASTENINAEIIHEDKVEQPEVVEQQEVQKENSYTSEDSEEAKGMTTGALIEELINRSKEKKQTQEVEISQHTLDKLYALIESSSNKDELSKLIESLNSIQDVLKDTHEITLSEQTISNLVNILNPKVEQAESIEFAWEEDEAEIEKKSIIGFDKASALEAVKSKGTLLLQGVPGTGKTLAMMDLINELTDNNTERYKVISFGQNTSNSEFIGGVSLDGTDWRYKDGIFVEMCKKAYKDKLNTYVLGIDEISRGNTELILGEAMTGLELRGRRITLSNGEDLIVPKNLCIIATMNVTDRSTASMDIATLQRFTIFRLRPQWDSKEYMQMVAGDNTDILNNLLKLGRAMTDINEEIKNDSALSEDNIIGTRCITIKEISNELLLREIDSTLRNTIEVNIKNASDGTRRDIFNIFDDTIKKLK